MIASFRRENDFGAFDRNGVRYFWKIDCYDRTMMAGSPDAADPEAPFGF